MINTKTAIIDYGAGNMFSIGAECRRFGYDITVTSDPTVIKSSDRVIFPGVGNAAAAREALDRSQLAHLIPQLTMPVLGICLGMQMTTRRSDEDDTYAPICDQSAAVALYGIPFSAALWHDNFFGCQCHPEKSGESGIRILKNFLEL